MTAPGVATRGQLRPAARRALTSVAVALTAVAVAVPGAVLVHTATIDPDAIPHEAAPSVTLDARAAGLAERLADAEGFDQPVILSYHDVRELAPGEEPEDHYTVTPEQFAAHVAALDAAGFRTISSDDLVAWLDGEPLPPRSVYLTFDDGSSGLWRHADAVLEAHGFRAAAFVITGRVGQHRPYYLDWDELASMRDTGRWDLESHTRLGHDRIPVDPRGEERLPFLINRGWLDGEDRLEHVDEVIDRVRRDLTGSKDDFARHGFERPRLFAYPFSAETRPSNDDAIPPRVAEILHEEFAAALSNDEPDRLVSERDRRRRSLSRIEVFRFTTAAGLLDRLATARPIDPRDLEPLRQPEEWVDSSGRALVEGGRHEASGAMPDSPDRRYAEFSDDGTLRAAPPSGAYLGAEFAPGRSEDWTDYGVGVTVSGLGEPEQGPSASLHALVGSPTPVQLSVSAGFARLRTPNETVDTAIPAADRHRLELRASDGQVAAVVDGATIAVVPVSPEASGGIALGASGVAASSAGVVFEHLVVGAAADGLAPPAPTKPAVPPTGFEPEPMADDWPADPDIDDEPTAPSADEPPTAVPSEPAADPTTSTPTTAPSTSTSSSTSIPTSSTTTNTTAPSSTTTSSTATTTTTTSTTSTTTTTTTEPPADDDRDGGGDG